MSDYIILAFKTRSDVTRPTFTIKYIILKFFLQSAKSIEAGRIFFSLHSFPWA